MRGRRPRPTHLKLITGNPGKRPLNPAEPKPASAAPPAAPAELSEEAKTEWRRVARRLYGLGLLSGIDRAALAAYCQAYGRWRRAERALAEMARRDSVTGGLLVKTSNGNAIQNPLVGIANKAMADMVRYAAEFGMTPSARSRISAGPQEGGGADPAAKYFD
ncbi:MAG: phage terminase small subunit P27 family [Acetobacteraceae bacterium]